MAGGRNFLRRSQNEDDQLPKSSPRADEKQYLAEDFNSENSGSKFCANGLVRIIITVLLFKNYSFVWAYIVHNILF